ncbi:GNAT family N-acetyltransferase [Rhizohabitans arisaemae]|uniref:GNAT family N-acetyltransferase n=1 Tax=Rhizohabitans arisaemae TaxID=2720610 RepID=UPI0024B23BCD|nr:GNAT family N-acetyltransferase [Rhizohabitans arisaemae]
MWVHLETERLLLRRFTEADEDDLVALDGDPEVTRFINGGKSTSREDARSRIARWLGQYEERDGFGFWAAVERGSGRFLGWFEFRPPGGEPPPGEVELGYRLRREVWGRGHATEGARALIRKGFTELGVERVIAHTMAVNLASRRVMEKSGLVFVRAFHQDWPETIEGSEHGDVEYALTRAEWEAHPEPR